MKKIKVIEEKKVPGLFGTKTVKKEKYLSPGDKGYKQAKKELERNKHMKVYIAAPLFSEGERWLNEHIDEIIRSCGHETFLPQRDGGCVADLPDIINGTPKRKHLFQLDCYHMDWCDAILFVFDGRVPDEGACFELGYCYAKGKKCIGYKTDARSFIDGFDNVMLLGAPETVLHNEDELRQYFEKL